MKAVRFDGVVLIGQAEWHYDLLIKLQVLLANSSDKYQSPNAVAEAMEQKLPDAGYFISGCFCGYDGLPLADQSGVEEAMKVWERQDA